MTATTPATAAATTTRIRIGQVEVSFEGPIERDQLQEVLRTVRSQLGDYLGEGDGKAARGPSAAQLLADSAARTFGEKAGVIAYWLEEHRGRSDWGSGEIVEVLEEAGEPAPANITDALNQKRKQGLFEVDDRRWRLSGEGRGWVRFRLLNQPVDDSQALD